MSLISIGWHSLKQLTLGRCSATSEVDAGLLQTFTIQPDGTLGPISNISTSGNGPTHILTTTNGTVSAMNVRYPLHLHYSG